MTFENLRSTYRLDSLITNAETGTYTMVGTEYEKEFISNGVTKTFSCWNFKHTISNKTLSISQYDLRNISTAKLDIDVVGEMLSSTEDDNIRIDMVKSFNIIGVTNVNGTTNEAENTYKPFDLKGYSEYRINLKKRDEDGNLVYTKSDLLDILQTTEPKDKTKFIKKLTTEQPVLEIVVQ